MNVTPLLNKIETARRRFNRHYQSLPVTALEGPDLPNGWSVKDLLGHISAWEQYLVDRLTGAETGPISDAEIDARNRATYQQRKDWSWQDVEAEAQTTFVRLSATLKSLPPEQLDDRLTAQLIAVNTFDHYAEHQPWLERWAARRRTERRR
ncbi:MAG: DinB family protein [Anaerolineae bacterium]